jgi:GNAT superfamily N-acetyltransferase
VLAGAPDDAEVDVGTVCGGGLYLEMCQPVTGFYRAAQRVRPARDGPAIVIEGFCIHSSLRSRGLGLQIFSRQLVAASALGVAQIEITAGRGEGENGYYTWPRFGFDGPLPPEIRRSLPLGLDHARHVLDLMEDDLGRRWWKANGMAVRLAFDLTVDSRSRHAFGRYVDAKRPPRKVT